jgi:Bacteriophage tail sheath protein
MTFDRYQAPGVYRQDIIVPRRAELRSGVPAFLGRAAYGHANVPQALTLWPQFEQLFGGPSDGYLWYAVRGFFQNGGRLCYVLPLEDMSALEEGLNVLAGLDTIDLVCAPDLAADPTQAGVLQQLVLDYCAAAGDRFAILDAWPCAGVADVLRQRSGLNATDGALYYPWIGVADSQATNITFVPPCGHVAGIYARSDQRAGVYKAPANEILEGVLDLKVDLSRLDQEQLNPAGVNCLRGFPGRGIRVWGARTLSVDPEWTYVNVRRLFLTVGRWIQRNMAGVVFEPHDQRLWTRIGRELNAYFTSLFQQGALAGSTPQQAFYVKCDAETNPPEVRDQGQVVTEIGLAPTVPYEFIVVQIIQEPSAVALVRPGGPGKRFDTAANSKEVQP